MKTLRSTRDTLGAFSKVTLNSHRCSVRWGTLLLSFASLCLAGKSLANPFGEKLKSGSAEFVRDGNNLLIHQGSDTLIIDWKSFSIGQGELTRFLQPGSDSAALNRVFGGNPSEIYGSLRANGKIYLINPNGVFIGPSGRVDAGSFVASTLDTSDEEFLKGGNLTFKGESDASVVNLGTITALDGDAFLIARSVENHGTINAPKGTAGLAAGTEVIIQPAGEEKIGVSIASGSGKVVNSGTIAAAQAELKAAGGNLYALAIKNTGTIRATGVERKGGRVFLRANSGTIANSGTVRARTVSGAGGKIVLGPSASAKRQAKAKSGVRIENSGTLDASGTTGGVVNLRADDISLSETSLISATGADGLGGEIRVEGSDVFVSNSANLNVDGALGGGSVFALAENTMEFHGVISALAVAENANGGFAEVSGLNALVFDGTANLQAAFGHTGTLLLDPVNFTIDATAAATIISNLSTSNVVISTAGAGAAAGDIFVNAPMLYNSANSLSLLAHRNIEANASIQNSGAGALNLIAGWDGVTGLGPQGVNFAAFTAAPSSYGNNSGSIFIGSGNQANAVLVGSRFGATNAAGFAMAVTGSDSGNTAAAQFGFHVDPGSGGVNINGPIQIVLKDDLSITGGGSNFAYAQVGHGGASSSGTFQGSITINVGGDLRVLGGVNFSYSQIGHGGEGSSGAQSGSIVVRANNLNLTGGTRPHANAQIGHGDGSGDASGTRAGLIDVLASGETTLMNGPGNNAIWLIGHGTNTASGVSNANVQFTTGTLDYSGGSVATVARLSQDFADKFSRNAFGGDVTIRATGAGGLQSDGAFAYATANHLTLISDTSATINGSIINSGSGEIVLVVDNANAVRPNLNPAASLTIASSATIQSASSVRIFATTPANTHLGNFVPAQQRYGVWYGDAVTVPGVNFKFQPTLTLTANSLTKTYGQTITFNGTEFTFTGLQPGDSLSQILSGIPALSSLGSPATAGVTSSPYSIVFDPGLTANFGYGLQLVPGALTVTPAPLTLTASNRTKVYGSTLTFAGTEFSSIGLKNGESVGLADLSSSGAITTATVAGNPYAITIANARGGSFNPANYTISYAPGALTVTPAALTITAANQSKVYGNTFTFNGTEFSSSGLLNGDTISSATSTSTGTAPTASVGGSPYGIAIGNALGTGLGNYSITYVPGAFMVTPAPLTLTASNQSKVYGNTFTFNGTEFSSSGLKNGESVGLVDFASPGAIATAGVAGSPYAITIANARGGSFNPANYAISYAPGGLTVTPAPLTITASNQGKVYGDSFTFNGTEFTSSGLRNSDTISNAMLSSTGEAPTAGVAGSPYPINIGNATGSGLGNYTIAYVPGALSVSPAPLTLTVLNQSKVYGTTFNFAGTEFSTAGLKNGETVGLVDFSSAGSPGTATVAGSPYAIAIANARGGTFNSANYAISYVPGALTVTRAALTITAKNQSKVYGTPFTFNGTEFTSVGLVNGDTVASTSLTSPGAISTAPITGSPYTIDISNAVGTGLGNYNITYVPGSLTVTQAGLIITAANQSKVYGSTFTFNGTEFTSVGLRPGDSISGVTLTSAGAVATAGVPGSPYTITIGSAVGSGLQNYTITYVPGDLTVTPAPLTLTALNQSKVYGSTFTFAGTEFSASGLKNGETVGLVDLTSAGSPGTANVAGSPYAIAISNAHGGTFNPANYAVSYVPGALTLTQAPLTVTATNQSKVYGNVFTFNGAEFTSTGLFNSDAVASASLTSPGTAATASVGGSPYAISISNAVGNGLGNYNITYVPGAFTVTQAGLIITAANQSKVYGNTFPFNGTEFTSSGLRNADTISGVTLTSTGAIPTTGVAGSPYTINIGNATGGGLGNYAITYVPGALTVTPAPLMLTALNQSKVYGRTFTFTGVEFSVTGLQNGESVGRADLTSAGAIAAAGVSPTPYSITIANARGGTFNPANYTVSYVPGALAVTQAPLTITASNRSKVYGDSLVFNGTEFTSVGLLNTDTISSASLTSAGTVLTASVGGSPYAINISNAVGTGLQNYAITYVPGALTVTPASLTLTALNQSKVYGNTFAFSGTEFSSSGLKNGETVGLVDFASPGALATAGVAGSPYAITIANARGGTFNPTNYAISYAPGALTVTPAPLTITASNQSKVYGSSLVLNGTEFTSTGLLNGDTVTGATLTSLGTAPIAGVAGSPYAINISSAIGTGLGNYIISYIPGALAVTPAPLLLTALNQSKVYGSTFNFNGTEFSAAGLQNGEIVGAVDFASSGIAPTVGVAGGPYNITIANARGGTFDPANYDISYANGTLAVTPASLVITALNQKKRAGNEFFFTGTEFKTTGLQNGETIGLVALSSDGAPSSASVGDYAIHVAEASGGTFDPTNYTVSFAEGTFTVTPKPQPPPPPPPQQPPPPGPEFSLEDLLRLLTLLEQNNQTTAQNGSDLASEGPSVISGFGISRLNLNTFFGEQLLEPGGALMIDATGLGPPLPIGEAPQDLENQLEDKPHEALEEAIAEDDQKAPAPKSTRPTRYYEVSPGQLFKANAPGQAGFEELSRGPDDLREATDESIEKLLLHPAAR